MRRGVEEKKGKKPLKDDQDIQKKRKEEEEAAKEYAQFVATFSSTEESKSFVRGGVMNPSDGTNKQTSTVYKPPFADSLSTKREEVSQPPEERERKRKKGMDELLEELKKEQEAPLELDNPYSQSEVGSYDTGDPNSTNLYVGNLSPFVTEELLCREFGSFGPIASVKIMWPRTSEEKERNRNCGFVSFMNRQDADKALKELDGKSILGNELRVGWGKSVPLPPQPIYDLKNISASQIKLPFNAQKSSRIVSNSVPMSGIQKTLPTSETLEIAVIKPSDLNQLRIIHRTIEFVINYGPSFEAIIMEREWNNPQFKFLFDNQIPEHAYYRWKLFSILQGDKVDSWKEEPFYMFQGCPIWIPLQTGNSQKKKELDEIAPKGPLSSQERQSFLDMLKNLTLERELICEAMIFAISHPEAAEEISELSVQSILQEDSSVHQKIARLYLISDILFNTSVKAAWKYRTCLESRLTNVFSHFHVLHISINARLKAEQLKNYVLKVLQVWSKLMIYTPNTVEQWQSIFLKKEKEEKEEKEEKPKKDFMRNTFVEVSSPPPSSNTTMGNSVEDEDIDGEPIS